MVTKKDLLTNIRRYSPQEIADAVRAGVVSLYELNKETQGAFTPLLKRQVKNILDAPKSVSDAVDPVVNSIPTTVTPTYQDEIPVWNDTPLDQEPESVSAIFHNDEPEIDSSETEIKDSLNTMTVEYPEEKPKMFSRVFSFEGRIRRLEYGLTYLAAQLASFFVLFLSSFLASLISNILGVREEASILMSTMLNFVMYLPILWIVLAQGAKRCHDRGNSGWYQIIPFYFLWLIFADGQRFTNRYGQCPK